MHRSCGQSIQMISSLELCGQWLKASRDTLLVNEVIGAKKDVESSMEVTIEIDVAHVSYSHTIIFASRIRFVQRVSML